MITEASNTVTYAGADIEPLPQPDASAFGGMVGTMTDPYQIRDNAAKS